MTDREIFSRILEADSSHAREQVLNEACGNDAAQRQRLEALLAEHQQLGQFLEVPPRVGGESTLPIACPGTLLGRYRLVSLLGEGGMGEVWIAEQTEPVRRRVALKLIKPGLDSRRVLARFEAERQALALMDHSHIATIYDGGMTPAGRPYFVMELVSGIPITEYCERHRVPLTERISLLIAVCQAVQHAHQKGVIHRDLKPSNILVAEGDGQPVPKVIDFGLAKATDASQLDFSWDTKHGQPLGTPLYMSPEQADRHNADIDVRSDVYSLGVVLYELLTGTTPLDRTQLQQAGEAEWLQLVREQIPRRPSLKLRERRSGPPDDRSPLPSWDDLRRSQWTDLDWIVLKALDKDRELRYPSANALAADLQRCLRRDPIEAGPPAVGYQLRRLLSKYRGLVATTVTVLLLLLTATTVSSWLAIRAWRAKEESRRLAIAERRARSETQQLMEAAERRSEELLAVLTFLQERFLIPPADSDRLATDSGFQETLRETLSLVEHNFQDQPLFEGRIRLALAYCFQRAGDLLMASQQAERARALLLSHLGADAVDTVGVRIQARANLPRAATRSRRLDFPPKGLPTSTRTIWPRRFTDLGLRRFLGLLVAQVGSAGRSQTHDRVHVRESF